jgi:hypothetical protein
MPVQYPVNTRSQFAGRNLNCDHAFGREKRNFLNNVAFELVARLLLILKVLNVNIGPENSCYLRFLVVYLTSFSQTSRCYPNFYHDNLLPHTCQFITRCSSSGHTPHTLRHKSVITYSKYNKYFSFSQWWLRLVVRGYPRTILTLISTVN